MAYFHKHCTQKAYAQCVTQHYMYMLETLTKLVPILNGFPCVHNIVTLQFIVIKIKYEVLYKYKYTLNVSFHKVPILA